MADIERINGFLDAVGCINQEGEVYSDYSFLKLPYGMTLLDSINKNILDNYKKYPVEYWHLSLEPISVGELKKGIEKWFYRTSKAKRNDWNENFVNAFMDLLMPFMGSASIYRLNMKPPIFYAIDWEEFVISGKQGDFLLYFNFSD